MFCFCKDFKQWNISNSIEHFYRLLFSQNMSLDNELAKKILFSYTYLLCMNLDKRIICFYKRKIANVHVAEVSLPYVLYLKIKIWCIILVRKVHFSYGYGSYVGLENCSGFRSKKWQCRPPTWSEVRCPGRDTYFTLTHTSRLLLPRLST